MQGLVKFFLWASAAGLLLAACTPYKPSGTGEALSATTRAEWTASAVQNLQAKLPSTLVEACNGAAVAGATAYSGSFHPIMWTFQEKAGFQPAWRAGFPPNSWKPQSLEEAQLVICEFEEELVLEECAYYGGPVTRYAYESRVWLVEAATGNLVAETSFQGAWPRECRETEPAVLTELRGDHVPSSELMAWVREFVGEPE